MDKIYYTYKITTTDSAKYYYGVRQIKKQNASEEDCLNDSYFGSGGNHPQNKFRNWKKKHVESLRKEIIEMFESKDEAYKAERILVGDLWRSDRNCLNSCAGEFNGQTNVENSNARVAVRDCPIHGLAKHQNDRCCACESLSRTTRQECSIHGSATFQGSTCLACAFERTSALDFCSRHGETLHRGSTCLKCSLEHHYSYKHCPIHGITTHAGNTCKNAY